MAILTNSGRAAMAESVRQREMFLSWGTGDEALELQPPDEGLITATSLLNEVGRRICEDVVFCEPDEEGSLITPTGRFSPSETISNNLAIKVTFDFEDAGDLLIRVFGIFTGTAVAEDLPVGKKYFTPDEIVNPGTLLVIERCAPIYRQVMTRETLCFVVTF
jgi:hypothetical protein